LVSSARACVAEGPLRLQAAKKPAAASVTWIRIKRRFMLVLVFRLGTVRGFQWRERSARRGSRAEIQAGGKLQTRKHACPLCREGERLRAGDGRSEGRAGRRLRPAARAWELDFGDEVQRLEDLEVARRARGKRTNRAVPLLPRPNAPLQPDVFLPRQSSRSPLLKRGGCCNALSPRRRAGQWSTRWQFPPTARSSAKLWAPDGTWTYQRCLALWRVTRSRTARRPGRLTRCFTRRRVYLRAASRRVEELDEGLRNGTLKLADDPHAKV
jgi:hypothetical protein